MAKELVSIVLSCAVWNKTLSRHNIEFRCDNLGVVEAVKKGSSKDSATMHLLQCLWFLTALCDIHVTISHIPGAINTLADLLSRNKIVQFHKLQPSSSSMPTLIPPALATLISPRKQDLLVFSAQPLQTAS